MLFSKTTRRLLLHLFILYVIIVACILTAFATYTLFYVWYIPKVKQTVPVYLHYNNHDVTDRPSAMLPLGGALSFAHGQSYDISLWLDVPETPENAALGNVMFGFDVLAKNATTFASARPFLLPQRSSLVHTAYLVPRLLPFATGWWQERRRYQLYLATSFVAPHHVALDTMHVWLSTGAFRVYAAELEVFARFSGPRYWMYYWFTSTSVLSIAAIAFWLSLLAIILYMTCLQRALFGRPTTPLAIEPKSASVRRTSRTMRPARSHRAKRTHRPDEEEKDSLYPSPLLTRVDPLTGRRKSLPDRRLFRRRPSMRHHHASPPAFTPLSGSESDNFVDEDDASLSSETETAQIVPHLPSRSRSISRVRASMEDDPALADHMQTPYPSEPTSPNTEDF